MTTRRPRTEAIPIQEAHHRVRNNLQVISSLLNIHSRTSDVPQVTAVLQEMQDQLTALVTVNKHLYRPENGGLARTAPLLTEVSERVLSRTEGTTSLISMRFSDVTMGTEQAVPLALLASEMLSYALDAVPIKAPEVSLVFKAAPDDHATLSASWDISHGAREVANADKRRTLITALATQLGAEPQFSDSGDHPAVSARFALDHGAPDTRAY